jgi:alanine-synthesizing transaminase
VMTLQALLDDGDEVLIPTPDYPLWTAATSLGGGTPVHYLCDERADWAPSLDDIEAKITSRTRALVLINPNNPTGAVYPRPVLEELVGIARRHRLIIFADEIYDRILYDDAEHVSIAALAPDLLCLTFGGLCPNVPGQHAIQAALGGYQSIDDLVLPTGRLGEQRDRAWKLLNDLPGVSCVKPKGALYVFPRIDPAMYPIEDDVQFAFDLLEQQRILVVQGTGFNWPSTDHFRVVTLQYADDLEEAVGRIGEFLESRRR